jgi:hypothetical protein
METKKQTAVEWLISNLYPTISIRLSDTYIKELTEKAKAMENMQKEIDYQSGYLDCFTKLMNERLTRNV